MEKTEMMKRYENETGKSSTRFVTDGVHSTGVEIWHFEYISWLDSKAKALDSHKAKPLKWSKIQYGSIYANCPQGTFCIGGEDGYSYQLFGYDGFPVTDAEGADSLAEAKQLCQEWLQEMVDKAMGFVEV